MVLDKTSHSFVTPGAGSEPKKVFVHGAVPETVFCTQWVPEPKRTVLVTPTVKFCHSVATFVHCAVEVVL